MKIGIGYDVHRLKIGCKLIIGGIEIPFDYGLCGHSDADVLLHSICDALLGAAGLGDIGELFPNTDKKYKKINSMFLLQKTYKIVINKKLQLVNLDTTIIAQNPNFSSYKNKITKNIANIMQVDLKKINVKATTTEYLGYIGKNKGIAAVCIALLS